MTARKQARAAIDAQRLSESRRSGVYLRAGLRLALFGQHAQGCADPARHGGWAPSIYSDPVDLLDAAAASAVTILGAPARQASVTLRLLEALRAADHGGHAIFLVDSSAGANLTFDPTAASARAMGATVVLPGAYPPNLILQVAAQHLTDVERGRLRAEPVESKPVDPPPCGPLSLRCGIPHVHGVPLRLSGVPRDLFQLFLESEGRPVTFQDLRLDLHLSDSGRSTAGSRIS